MSYVEPPGAAAGADPQRDPDPAEASARGAAPARLAARPKTALGYETGPSEVPLFLAWVAVNWSGSSWGRRSAAAFAPGSAKARLRPTPRPAVYRRDPAEQQDAEVDEPEQGELEEDEGDGAERHPERAPEAGQQAGPHRVEAGVDHGDHEADLAGEAEAGGEAAQRARRRSLRRRCRRRGRCSAPPLGHQARHFVGDEVRGGVQGRDAAEDRQHGEEERRAMTTPTSWPRMRSLRALAARKR